MRHEARWRGQESVAYRAGKSWTSARSRVTLGQCCWCIWASAPCCLSRFSPVGIRSSPYSLFRFVTRPFSYLSLYHILTEKLFPFKEKQERKLKEYKEDNRERERERERRNCTPFRNSRSRSISCRYIGGWLKFHSLLWQLRVKGSFVFDKKSLLKSFEIIGRLTWSWSRSWIIRVSASWFLIFLWVNYYVIRNLIHVFISLIGFISINVFIPLYHWSLKWILFDIFPFHFIILLHWTLSLLFSFIFTFFFKWTYKLIVM